MLVTELFTHCLECQAVLAFFLSQKMVSILSSGHAQNLANVLDFASLTLTQIYYLLIFAIFEVVEYNTIYVGTKTISLVSSLCDMYLIKIYLVLIYWKSEKSFGIANIFFKLDRL